MRIYLGLLVFIIPIYSQSFAEHAAAAAGAAIGTLGGKVVSDGITALSATAEAASTTASPARKPTSAPKMREATTFDDEKGVPKSVHAQVPPVLAVGSGLYFPQPVHRVDASPRRQEVRAVVAPPEDPMVETAPDAEQLRSVHAGMDAAQILALGTPSARITIPEEGHLIEVFDYHPEDGPVVAIHIDNGVVTSVDQP